MVDKIAGAAAGGAVPSSTGGADFGEALRAPTPSPGAGKGPGSAGKAPSSNNPTAGQRASGATAPQPAQGPPAPQSAQAAQRTQAAQKAQAAESAQAAQKAQVPQSAQAARAAQAPEKAQQADVPSSRPGGAKLLNAVQQAQARLDKLLQMAESGKTFSASELIAFQAHAYRASQELEMASKVVEKGSSAVKQTLQTQI